MTGISWAAGGGGAGRGGWYTALPLLCVEFIGVWTTYLHSVYLYFFYWPGAGGRVDVTTGLVVWLQVLCHLWVTSYLPRLASIGHL